MTDGGMRAFPHGRLFLRLAAGLSTNVIAKLGKNQNVSTEVLGKICKALNCEVTDIMEFVDDKPEDTKDNT